MIIENSLALELGTLVGNVGTGGVPGFHDVIQVHFDDSCLELLHGTLVVFWRTSLRRAVKDHLYRADKACSHCWNGTLVLQVGNLVSERVARKRRADIGRSPMTSKDSLRSLHRDCMQYSICL